MAHLDELEKEISDLENGAFSNPTDNASVSTKAEDKVVTEETFDVTQVDDVPIAQADAVSGEPIVQEKVVTDFDVQHKPARTNWKKKYQDSDKRFRHYKGANDSTTFELRNSLASSIKEVASLREQVFKLTEQLSAVKTSETKYKDLLTEDEQEIIGEDTLVSFEKLNRAAIEAAVNPLKAELEVERTKRNEQDVEYARTLAAKATNTFLGRLGNIVNDYAEVNVDPEFVSWMNGPDELEGIPRKAIFKGAEKSGDAGRVAQFFLEFKKQKQEGEDVLAQKITPTTSTSQPTVPKQPTNSNPRAGYVSMKKVGLFLDAVAKGHYRGRESEVKEIEAEINRAQVAGKLVA